MNLIQLWFKYEIWDINFNLIMQSTLSKDEFLNSKEIQIEKSSFLRDHYARKSLGIKDSYNPRDPHGSRLSHFWKEGDTISSVILKKIQTHILYFMNPDTYSKRNTEKVKKLIVKEKIRIIGTAIIFFIVTSMIYPQLRPRLMKVRRQFLFQYYLQSQMISKRLGAKTQKIPKEQMEKMINEIKKKMDY